uniref:Serine/threonine-protein phosphatase 7 long form homolog n=1 Tax=Nicotiana tabacum TaxID=4097 RepID=A0A1S4AV30_TOBAC|nr:PREDICTED: serine/threonine-protein phosphatase 7 long form homolog [Nicotiana tabacum]
MPVDGHPVALPQAMRELTGGQVPGHAATAHWFPATGGDCTGWGQSSVADDYPRPFGVSLRFHHLEDERLDDIPQYSWGAAVLAYLYRQLCRATMGTQRDVAGFLLLLQVWAWERFMQLQPPLTPLAPGVPPPFLPLARRWVLRRGYGREYEARHNLPLCRDLLDLLEGAQFIWTLYSDSLIAGLPDYCSAVRLIWSSSVPLMCLDIVEHHATEWVLRQFGRPQLVPPTWQTIHFQRDDRSRVDHAYAAWLEVQIDTWDWRLDLIPPPPSPCHTNTEHD